MDSSSTTTLLLHLPHLLASLLIIWVISLIFPTWLGTSFILVWLASGALMFHRPTERVVARLFYRVRPPTAAELARLQPLWDEVTRRAGLDGTRYDLWIEDSDEVNAFGAAGHMVGVTRNSLNRLTPDRLAAVLAHELGHHVNGHTWAGLLGVYYGLPARIAMIIATYVTVFAVALAAQFSVLAAVILVLVSGGFAVAIAFTFPPAFALPAIPLLISWAGRRGELRADRFAGDIGYGPMLITVFTDSLNRGADMEERQQGPLGWLLSTHPPLHTRIRALEIFTTGPPGSRPS
ncbi:M48 family metalloprotease [Streptomyces sp. NPDC016469]|uniref:M48 family metalloprotease n=1 Tax=Streptomyces sp. NPDC016469 TaxID=3157191 RepID=UPI0033E21A55